MSKTHECPKCSGEDLRVVLGDLAVYVCDGCGAAWSDPKSVCDPQTDELRSAVYAALAKVAKERLDRRALTEGGKYHLVIPVVATVGNMQFSEIVVADVRIGHDTPSSSSSGPKAEGVLARALAKLNSVTCEQFLREFPEEFARNGNQLPPCDAALVKATKQMLDRLRTKEPTTKAAPISVSYKVEGTHP